ncbi:MAG: DNA-3-methyladenine glycosylase [Bacteroidales bacterium]|nr:DNA-3-methyladenine glycosylase [Bacteroidales bacterium]
MRFTREFYCRDVLEVAPDLIGTILVRNKGINSSRYLITEVEAYRGEEDQACHARFGLTSRNAIMYDAGGKVYVYLVYGMYWMLNIVAGAAGTPQAVLIRGITGYDGPGKLTRALEIDKGFYGEDLVMSDTLWLEESPVKHRFIQTFRIGIDYASEPWKSMPWRYLIRPQELSASKISIV